MNLDLSLMACLFREAFDWRLTINEKRHENDKSNMKYFHIYSWNQLSYLFSTKSNSSITTSYIYKTIPQFYEFTAKVYLVDKDRYQTIGYIVSNTDRILTIEIINQEDDIESIDIYTLM